jgi:tripartite-type tricarboxylate transporter receptor subunit TctC
MHSAVRIFLILLYAFEPERCLAGSYPGKPIKIVTAGVGSSADFAARLIGQGLLDNFGHAVVVDNRGSGVVPGELVARAAPDGYTLLLMGTTFWLAPFLHDNTPYDPVNDFLPITLAAQAPNILVVHGLLPVKTVRDLIALATASALNLPVLT